jgi:hypothetical protein
MELSEMLLTDAEMPGEEEGESCPCPGQFKGGIKGHFPAGLGHLKCGCAGDSGVYINECEAHSPEATLETSLKAQNAKTAWAIVDWMEYFKDWETAFDVRTKLREVLNTTGITRPE